MGFFFLFQVFLTRGAALVQILRFACQFVLKPRTLGETVLNRAGHSACLWLWAQERWSLTFSALGEVLLGGLIEPDPERGRTYLSLEASRQSVIELQRPFRFCQSDDCSQDASILRGTGVRAFTLDLGMRKVQVKEKGS